MTSPVGFCDRRLGGVARYYAYEPDDWKMRIPDNILNCVCFLGIEIDGGKNAGKFLSFGTGFVVAMQKPPYYFSYLVTAQHLLDEATRVGHKQLLARFNMKDGTTTVVRLPDNDKWVKMVDTADDLVVAGVPVDFNIFDCAALPMHMFPSTDTIKNYGIGPGDEVFTVGLFTMKAGNQRNMPIVRSGIISAMPHKAEPFKDKKGKPYFAYLVELRSIGGLSGSPVFVFIDNRNRIVQYQGLLTAPQDDWTIFCLGIIRGHWDLKRDLGDSVLPDVDDAPLGVSRGETLNTGIALVTPSWYVTHILNHPKLEATRREYIEMREKQEADQVTEDSAPLPKRKKAPDEPLTRSGFEDALKRVSAKVSEPESGKTRTSE